ncbi:MAG: hypothetical protein ABSG64_12035 [Solirubrobacteraceae bacterium]
MGGLAAALLAMLIAGAAPAAASSHPTYLTFIGNATMANPYVAIANVHGGDPRILGPGSSAMIAPDGALVAVVQTTDSGSGTSLVMYPATGGSGRQLFEFSGFLTLLGWSADSRLLLAFAPSPNDGAGSLLAISAATGARNTIATGVIAGASFSPSSSDDIVYGLAHSPAGASGNLYRSSPTGNEVDQITHNGDSSNPLWGPHGIVFARQHSRGSDEAPISQLWQIQPNGTAEKQLTNIPVGPLVSGLVPIAFSADGEHLLAACEGEDTLASWTVDLSGKTAVAHDLNDLYDGNKPDGISRDGKTVLYSTGFEGAPMSVDTVPWGGGKVTVLSTQGTNPSWNN